MFEHAPYVELLYGSTQTLSRITHLAGLALEFSASYGHAIFVMSGFTTMEKHPENLDL